MAVTLKDGIFVADNLFAKTCARDAVTNAEQKRQDGPILRRYFAVVKLKPFTLGEALPH